MTVKISKEPWKFACQWYDVDEIFNAINRERRFRQTGDLVPVPEDVHSREFSEWLTEQYRLAMRKGAEMATNELRNGIESVLGRPEIWITQDEREGWNLARREVERVFEPTSQANNRDKA